MEGRLRILAIAHSYPLHPGDGNAPFMSAIVDGLAARGHLLDVVLPQHPCFLQAETDSVRFHQYRYSPVRGWAPWGFGNALTGGSNVKGEAALALPAALISLRRRISGLLSEERYDVVHAHWLAPNAWVASALARQRGIPLVVSLHGSDMTIAERTWPLRPVWHGVLRGLSGLTAPSEDLRLRAVRLGADPAKTATVHYGVDTTVFAPRELPGDLRASLGAPPDALLVIAVGRLVEKKGFRYLIEACSQLERTHLAIVGEGDLRPELERLARKSGASVNFTGHLDHRAVADAVAASDVVAVPSVVDSSGNVDGLPNTLLEALAAGRPVVASSVGGIPEVIADDVNGLLVRERDVAALADCLASLRDDPETRHRLGHEARVRAQRELTWDAAIEAFERTLLRAIA